MTIEFNIEECSQISGIKIITPSSHKEIRGSIWTSYYSEEINKLLPKTLFFKHDKFSISKRNVLRGIHGDNKSWKLVSCVSGSIYQVIVDMRDNSKTFLKWKSYILNNYNNKMLLLPPGIGNAFYVKSNTATYHYKLAYKGNYADVNEQFSVSWNDQRININWPTSNPILSTRDQKNN